MERRKFLKAALVLGGLSILDFNKMNSLFARVKKPVTKDMLQGLIFDIQRFGIHDGLGIRTVVFFKGCPLSSRFLLSGIFERKIIHSIAK